MNRRLAALMSGVVVLACSTIASPAPTTAAPAGAPRVTLIGDSTMAVMRWSKYDNADADLVANNDVREIIGSEYDLLFSAESCRRLVLPSCRGREGYVPISVLPLMRTTFAGQMGDVLVIMAGYNDPALPGSVDQVMAEADRQGIDRVVWLTFPTNASYVLPGGQPARGLYAAHNEQLRAAATRYPSMRLLDWDTYSNEHREWFAPDGVHLSNVGGVALARYIRSELDTLDLGVRCSAGSALAGAPSAPISLPPSQSTPASGFVARTPLRVADTREVATGGSRARALGAGRTITIELVSAVPETAVAAALTVTAVEPCSPGFLTVFACGERPITSNINYEVGRTTAGLVISTMTQRRVCVHTYATTDVVVDVTGWFEPSGSRFHPVSPTRWIDTRGLTSLLPQISGVRRTGDEIEVPVAGVGGVPSSASAVWINLTVADPTAATVLQAYPGPCGAAATASTVNARPGLSMGASALVGVGPDGSVCVRTVAGSSGIVVDVAGWFAPDAGGLVYSGRTPTRLLDTRDISPFPAATTRQVARDAVSVLNVTAAESTGPGVVIARPCGDAGTSSLVNTATWENTANLTAVGAGAGGSVCIEPTVRTHIVVDLFGSFTPPG